MALIWRVGPQYIDCTFVISGLSMCRFDVDADVVGWLNG